MAKDVLVRFQALGIVGAGNLSCEVRLSREHDGRVSLEIVRDNDVRGLLLTTSQTALLVASIQEVLSQCDD